MTVKKGFALMMNNNYGSSQVAEATKEFGDRSHIRCVIFVLCVESDQRIEDHDWPISLGQLAIHRVVLKWDIESPRSQIVQVGLIGDIQQYPTLLDQADRIFLVYIKYGLLYGP